MRRHRRHEIVGPMGGRGGTRCRDPHAPSRSPWVSASWARHSPRSRLPSFSRACWSSASSQQRSSAMFLAWVARRSSSTRTRARAARTALVSRSELRPHDRRDAGAPILTETPLHLERRPHLGQRTALDRALDRIRVQLIGPRWAAPESPPCTDAGPSPASGPGPVTRAQWGVSRPAGSSAWRPTLRPSCRATRPGHRGLGSGSPCRCGRRSCPSAPR